MHIQKDRIEPLPEVRNGTRGEESHGAEGDDTPNDERLNHLVGEGVSLGPYDNYRTDQGGNYVRSAKQAQRKSRTEGNHVEKSSNEHESTDPAVQKVQLRAMMPVNFHSNTQCLGLTRS